MNDKIYCVGDSITHNGIYISYIYDYMSTHYSERKLRLINKGKCGDTAFDALQRLSWDMLKENISGSAAIVMFGMNDVKVDLYPVNSPQKEKQKEDLFIQYKRNMHSLIELLLQKGLIVTLVSPSPYDQTAKIESVSHYGANDSLALYSEYCSDLATQFGVKYIDIHSRITELNSKIQSSAPDDSLIDQDRVHPKRIGSLIIAYLILKGMDWIKASPEIRVDRNSGKTSTTECEIIKKNIDKSKIHLAVKPMVMPGHEDEIFLKAANLIPIRSWNRFELHLDYFSQDSYSVKINGTDYQRRAAETVNLFEFSDEIKSIVEKNNKLNDERRQLEGILRDIVMVDVNLKRQGIAYDDQDSINTYFQNEYLKAANKEWFDGVRKSYDHKANISDVKQEINNKIDMMYRHSIPDIQIDIH